MRLDEAPSEAILIVEFYEDAPEGRGVEERLDALMQRDLGLRSQIVTDPAEMEMVWALRKAGLSLVVGQKGPAKPVAGLEDVAVRPEQLPEFVEAVRGLMQPLGLDSSFYGHAASGLLHIRPVVDLHRAEDIAKFRRLAEELFALTRQFNASMAAEHGVGIARAEFMTDQVGEELVAAMRDIKNLFDPSDLLNPGKVFPDAAFRIETHLRQGDGYRIELPFEPVLAFAAKDGSFIGNLEQCNGCGACLKDAPTMCPTFIATGEEIMSTRGRANTVRAVLDGRLDGAAPLCSEALDLALSNCLACKACAVECPSNVNLPLLKADLVHARHKQTAPTLLERVVGNVDLLGKLGCLMPGLANASLRNGLVRSLMEKALGISAARPMPRYTTQRFDRWFAKRNGSGSKARGRVLLWDDCFVRYNEPHIGKAAVTVLEAAGYEVVLPKDRRCCGRPAFSMGLLDKARRLGEHNVDLFRNDENGDPIVFLEPSCFSMFVQDYIELGVPGAEDVAQRCVLFEQFVYDLLEAEPNALPFQHGVRAAIHAHCHTKALCDAAFLARLVERLPDSQARVLESGCCGMAGAFGMRKEKYALSLQVAEPLVDMVKQLEPGTTVVASGTSCRQQIEHLTHARPLHMAELLANALGQQGE